MKKTGAFLLSASLLLQLAIAPIANAVEETSTQSTTEEERKNGFEINKNVQIADQLGAKIMMKVGEKGKFQLTPLKSSNTALDDIALEAKPVIKLKSTADGKILNLKEDGSWEALKDGEVTLLIGYEVSNAAKAAAEQKGYSLDDHLKEITVVIGQHKTMPYQVDIQSKGMTITMERIIKKGDKGNLKPTVKLANGPKDKKYRFYYHYDEKYLDINEETGEWTAKQAGAVEIRYGYNAADNSETETSTTEGSTTESTSSSTSSSSSSSSTSSSSSSSSTDSSSTSTSTDAPVRARSNNVENKESGQPQARAGSSSTTESSTTSSSTTENSTSESTTKNPTNSSNTGNFSKEQLANMAKTSVAITENDKETFWSNYGMTVAAPAPLKVGAEVALQPAVDFGVDVPFKGTYRYTVSTPEILSVVNDDTIKGLKAGTGKINYAYQMDAATLKSLAADEKFDLAKLTEDTSKEVLVTVTDDGTNTTPWIHKGMSILLPSQITVGEEYKFKINMDETVKFDGQYKFDYNKDDFDFVINSDGSGTLTAKRTGTLSFKYGYIPSDAMYAELVKANDGKALTEDPGIYELNAQAVAKPDPAKQFPQTGEQRRQWLMIAGGILILIVVVVIIVMKKKDRRKSKGSR